MEEFLHHLRLLPLVREVGHEERSPEVPLAVLALDGSSGIGKFSGQEFPVIVGREGDSGDSVIPDEFLRGDRRLLFL